MARVFETLDPQEYLEAMSAAAGVMASHAGALDALGPGSEGSDMAATLAAAVDGAEGGPSFAQLASSMQRAAESAASTAAGRTMAALLGGMAEVLVNSDRVDASRFALALEAGAEALAPRDDGRHPGGFVSVASAAADAALDAADRGSSLGDTMLAAANAGIEELEKGPVLDAGLAELGAVDPAAAAYLLMLDSLASIATGEPLPEPPEPDAIPPRGEPSGDHLGETYRIGCRLHPHEAGIEALADLRAGLHPRCESYRAESAGGHWEVEAVTALPGSVVELIASMGDLGDLDIRVVGPAAAAGHSGSPAGPREVVVVPPRAREPAHPGRVRRHGRRGARGRGSQEVRGLREMEASNPCSTSSPTTRRYTWIAAGRRASPSWTRARRPW
ncbi:MAG: hypothetical protein R2716_06310 [Microthrixaceae bacterium]